MSIPSTRVRRVENPTHEIKVQCDGTCNASTKHEILAQIDEDFSEEDFQAWTGFYIIKCRGCDSISFCKRSSNSEDYEYDHNGNSVSALDELLYPSRIPGNVALRDTDYIPHGVLKIYKETHQCIAANLPIVAGIGIRAIVEAVCKDKSAPGGRLVDQIDGLATIGLITKDASLILHNIRVMGNEAAHEAKANSLEELRTAFEIVEHLLLTAYIVPAKAAKLKKPKKTP